MTTIYRSDIKRGFLSGKKMTRSDW